MSASFTLVLETSTPHASLATIEPDGRMQQREFTSDRSHNAVLFSPLQELLDARQAPQIGLVLVGSGPGNYSGTRVGIAAAQGVAIASGCPAVAVPSILAVRSADDGAACLAIGDARRGSFWTARIEGSCLLDAPELTDADGLQALVSEAASHGLGVFSFEDAKRFPLPAELIELIRLEVPDAGRLWQIWKASPQETRERWLSEPPQPMYLKPPHITPAKRSWLVRPLA
ncbi:tRNA (adenosine(37)-N6)-threonylcarbamoyltransferase complex dimerization subunit type 1 TsaB [Luteolibacter yonseiensis]|uniref:tRNA (Adenosine(37)-N6)-threonylcarbamoyltransferase complex dimerization subunit type 1 TsaB n=1 Tax=Luteolibacter yonseiensis TaxID=1144680 RepID=A0A934V8S8_9BACT|nr:tRNA (adenosine(37)-N6)-threonylcarbamoyltransferase complex dimerization subunit type 1 TsaB [Luteolibacter yonseiensis]MBK1814433.1 tRNA (adenosine(37)-N6)-threonylcarbamoyltransferase complex dimerization subunit type 1 TsaB [Luteolibacter yonseiensis]